MYKTQPQIIVIARVNYIPTTIAHIQFIYTTINIILSHENEFNVLNDHLNLIDNDNNRGGNEVVVFNRNDNSTTIALLLSIESIFNSSSSTSTTANFLLPNDENVTAIDIEMELPAIPAYIRYTSMAFCIGIMVFGVIGNVMVSYIRSTMDIDFIFEMELEVSIFIHNCTCLYTRITKKKKQVPFVLFRTKDMRNSTNIFLTNLSVADLLVLLVCTPTVLVEINSKPETWVLGHELCKLSATKN